MIRALNFEPERKPRRERNERVKKAPPKIAVLDFETDPFLFGRKPEVFAAGFYDGNEYVDFWSRNCAEYLFQYLQNRDDELLIYAHNGGKFDFFYFIERGLVNNPIVIINGRIVKIGLGRHELRDSFAIIPVALAAYQKDKIDYDKFEQDVRENHRPEILKYLKSDCIYLYELVSAFVARFGTNLTVGGTAIKELQKFHTVKRGNEYHDAKFRPFYYGGRVSCLEIGIIEGNFKSYDVNSMYPHVMRNFRHPFGVEYAHLTEPTIDGHGNVAHFGNRPYFARVIAQNKSALPTRTKEGLLFDAPRGEFFTCDHELRVALKYDLIAIEEVKEAFVPLGLTSFDKYVDNFVAEKIKAKKDGDRIAELFAKFMLNSAYGKFGQNPAHYFDYFVKRFHEKIPSGYELYMDYGEWEIWRKPSPKPRYFDVAIAASITSASRAVLLDGLCRAQRPLYCDTDSVICEKLNVPVSDTDLGHWKIDAEGDLLAIAGKKLYAMFKNGICVKMASKGADLEPEDILALARGKSIVWRKQAPTFKLGMNHAWLERTIKRTVGAGV